MNHENDSPGTTAMDGKCHEGKEDTAERTDNQCKVWQGLHRPLVLKSSGKRVKERKRFATERQLRQAWTARAGKAEQTESIANDATCRSERKGLGQETNRSQSKIQPKTKQTLYDGLQMKGRDGDGCTRDEWMRPEKGGATMGDKGGDAGKEWTGKVRSHYIEEISFIFIWNQVHLIESVDIKLAQDIITKPVFSGLKRVIFQLRGGVAPVEGSQAIRV
ncbi:hypothetical protein JB92DRAFT_2825865 [Gautieria morchelliformis]|nr:hypothetical protein JB92DRAFT_2825865 [Gautieria morchelliformis]